MVNQYQDEKSQPILILVIDKAGFMKMPFDGLKAFLRLRHQLHSGNYPILPLKNRIRPECSPLVRD